MSKSGKVQTLKNQERKKVNSTATVKWADGDHAHTAPFVSLPLEPVSTHFSKDRSVHTREELRSSQAEERRRQKIALIRHVHRLQSSESPQHRRLLSGNMARKQQQQKYYEVTSYSIYMGMFLLMVQTKHMKPQSINWRSDLLLDSAFCKNHKPKSNIVESINVYNI